MVDPPRAIITAMAFSNAALVMICRGRMPARSSAITDRPDAKAKSSRRRSTAGGRCSCPGGTCPRASATAAMVLAVNIPAHEPSVGHALCSMRLQLLIGEGVDCVSAHRFEDLSDVEGPVAQPAGKDRAAVQEDAGQIDPGGSHQHAGKGLVAAGQGDHAVEPLGVHHRLDRVGDDLAADQRGPHALMPHRDAVGDGDGDELEGEAAGRTHPLLGPLGQAVEGEVARRDFVPGRDHPDLRLVPVVVGHAPPPGAWPGPAPGWAPRSPGSCAV